ncbi:MAG: hypothetical protein ACKVH0_21785 [Alphaproteobacteria bacterium]
MIELTNEDRKDLSVTKLAHRKRLLAAIAELKGEVSAELKGEASRDAKAGGVPASSCPMERFMCRGLDPGMLRQQAPYGRGAS